VVWDRRCPPAATFYGYGISGAGGFLFFSVFRNRFRGTKIGWSRAALQILALVALSTVSASAINSLRADRLPLVGDWSPAGRITTATGERMDISLFEAQKLFANDAAVFIDARPTEDYSQSHIQGARSLPWHDVDLKFMVVTQDLELETPIITYCDGETCELSHNLALFLRDAGFQNTRVLVKRMVALAAGGDAGRIGDGFPEPAISSSFQG